MNIKDNEIYLGDDDEVPVDYSKEGKIQHNCIWLLALPYLDSPNTSTDVFAADNMDNDTTDVKIVNSTDYTGDDDSSGDEDNYDDDNNRLESNHEKVDHCQLDIQEVRSFRFPNPVMNIPLVTRDHTRSGR